MDIVILSFTGVISRRVDELGSSSRGSHEMKSRDRKSVGPRSVRKGTSVDGRTRWLTRLLLNFVPSDPSRVFPYPFHDLSKSPLYLVKG